MEGSFWEVILGGFLATAGGAVVAAWERKRARELRIEERNLLVSAKVFESVIKIGEIRAWTVALKRSVDSCFDDAARAETANLDPGIKVVPIVLSSILVEAFSTEELGNCLKSGDIGLLENLLDLQSNYRVTFELVRVFNEQRYELNNFTMQNATDGDFVDGVHAKLEFEARHKHGLDVRVTQLNQFVGEIMDSYARGLVKSETIMSRFTSAMNSISGIKVPSVTFVEGN